MVIDYYIGDIDNRDDLIGIMDALPIRYAVQVSHWSSLRIGSFRENFTVAFQDGNSFWLGVGLNANKPLHGRIRLEANPNKCAAHAAFLLLLEWLNTSSRKMHTTVKRYDLAIDIPVIRSSAHLVKDNRVYSERRHGQEWTEYLGSKSSTVGRVKLYNKQIEAKLPYPLTRLELTLDPATPFSDLPWPVVYYIDTRQIGIDEMRVTDTERFVLGALLEGYGSLTDLGRKTKEKMKLLLEYYVKWVTISEADYKAILSRLQSFLKYPASADRDFCATISDKPPAPPLPDWVQDADDAPRD